MLNQSQHTANHHKDFCPPLKSPTNFWGIALTLLNFRHNLCMTYLRSPEVTTCVYEADLENPSPVESANRAGKRARAHFPRAGAPAPTEQNLVLCLH